MQQSVKLHKSTVDLLKKSKNLLAFSAGIDSSALFFILKSYDIEFDISIVNYNTREQSKDELEYAKKLANKYNKKVYIHSCKLDTSNFEHNARIQRYDFFEKIIKAYGYNNLITAHQLNDRLEWFLMQLSRGSGLVELLGMQEVELNTKYNKIKPLLHVERGEIEDFLTKNGIKYFFDESNNSQKYFRNTIRNRYAKSFVKEYKNGLINSFEYLQNDKDILLPKNEKRVKDLFILKREDEELNNIRQIDKAVKKLGVLMSGAQRQEVLRTKDCVISDKIAIVFNKNRIYISPYVKTNMPKKFKESCRIAKIPLKIRPYLYKESISFLELNHKETTAQ